MKLTPRQREQIDACRPGSDDLSLPALAELAQAVEQDRAVAEAFESSQRFDRSVAAALHEMAVPPGLLERLLVRLEEETSQNEADVATTVLQADTARAVSLPAPKTPEPRRASRRRWLQAAGGVTAAAALAALLALWLWPRPLPEVSPGQLAMQAAQWMDQDLSPSAWRSVAAPPSEYPQGVLLVQPHKRQSFRTAEGWNGTAYRSETVGGVTLFVFSQPPAEVVVGTVPFTRLPASQGRSMGAWQSDGKLFVVVIERGAGLRLEQVLRQPRTA